MTRSPATAPPVAGLRELKKSRTRQQLAETALRMFAERGYAQTSVEEIAREAQFGVTTFFRHFATKEEVAFYDQRNWMDEIPEVLRDLPPEQVWPAVRDATLGFIDAFEDPHGNDEHGNDGHRNDGHRNDGHGGIGAIRRTLWLEEPAVARRFAEICQSWESVIADAIADRLGLDVDLDPYPRMAGTALIGAARAALWHQQRHGGSMSEHARACLAVVEPCLRRPPEQTRASAAPTPASGG